VISGHTLAFNISAFFQDTGLFRDGFPKYTLYQYHKMQNVDLLSFESGAEKYGFAFFTRKENKKYNDLTLQISEAFLANAFCLDFLNMKISKKSIPKYLAEDYIDYNLKKNVSLKVNKLLEKRVFLGGIYTGYMMIVDNEDISVSLFNDDLYTINMIKALNNIDLLEHNLDNLFAFLHTRIGSGNFNDGFLLRVYLYHIFYEIKKGYYTQAKCLYDEMRKNVEFIKECNAYLDNSFSRTKIFFYAFYSIRIGLEKGQL
jgi:hypothetical protein